MRLPVALGIVALISGRVDAQATPDTGVTIITPASASEASRLGLKLIGVFDDSTGDWIARAIVRDTLGHEATTSPIGVATLNVLTPLAGYFVLEIRKPGYESAHLRLRADTAAQFLVALHANPLGATALDPVVTTARQRLDRDPGLRERFLTRCQIGAACVGPAEIARRPTSVISDLLAQTPGVHRNCTGTAGITGGRYRTNGLSEVATCKISMSAPTVSGSCDPYYFVDGVPWETKVGNGDVQSQIEKSVDFSKLTGIEVYLTDQAKPAKFDVRIPVGCGAIVLWTR